MSEPRPTDGQRNDRANAPYGPELAAAHHRHFGTVADHAAETLLRALRDGHMSTGTVMDLGCGSGVLSRHVAEAGFEVVGVDSSADMLAIARTEVPSATFIEASVLDVQIPPCVGAALVGEVVNYALGGGRPLLDLDTTLERVYDALSPGGVLVIDAAGPGRGTPARTVAWDGDDYVVTSSTSEADPMVTRVITTFVPATGRGNDNLWRRADETHRLRTLDPDLVESWLQRLGFIVHRLDSYSGYRLPQAWQGFLAVKPAASTY